jgi:hypothetical protein
LRCPRKENNDQRIRYGKINVRRRIERTLGKIPANRAIVVIVRTSYRRDLRIVIVLTAALLVRRFVLGLAVVVRMAVAVRVVVAVMVTTF